MRPSTAICSCDTRPHGCRRTITERLLSHPLSLITTSLIEVGESIWSEHPERESALTESDAIKEPGIRSYAPEQGISIAVGLQSLIEGLALP